MDISKNLLEMEPEDEWVALAQKIAIYTVLPFLLVVAFESIFKNLVYYNLANLAITGFNACTGN